MFFKTKNFRKFQEIGSFKISLKNTLKVEKSIFFQFSHIWSVFSDVFGKCGFPGIPRPGGSKTYRMGPGLCMAHFFYINPKFETCGASIWTKKLNLGTPTVRARLRSSNYYSLRALLRLLNFASSTLSPLPQQLQCCLQWLLCIQSNLNAW